MKSFLKDVLIKTALFALLNIPVILAYFIISLILKVPYISELVAMLKENSPAFGNAFNTALYLLYTVFYYVFVLLTVSKNTLARASYLNATAGERYSFKDEFSSYIKGYLAVDFTACAVMSLVSLLPLSFTDNGFLNLFFVTQYSLKMLVGNLPATAIYILFTPIFLMFVTLFTQKKWHKNRLGGKTEN